MKLKESISIEEFDGKRFQIKIVEPVSVNHKKAVITHYLHNIKTKVGKHYEKEALKSIKQFVEYKIEEGEKLIVADSALQQLLFVCNMQRELLKQKLTQNAA
jgi:DNA (cytosine-5)-methyltransferase 1